MTDLRTIAAVIDGALARGITGEQAINLLRAIRAQINDQSHDPAETQQPGKNQGE
jgi:hypothetical protein